MPQDGQCELDGRRWADASKLADLRQVPDDPALEADLAQMGGEIIDPWDQ